ncbi:hypothetical protein A3K86_03145 [Photobacterium jeanii]|uniref:GlyGly-CTERM sorting domain-containing protein n=1 Tax=Photobacterium jeanii TaxID=858640 RepID=A0A178KKM2_9GAMM|nr:DUF3466 family protein [Photobacterium jeanii]OAN17928.1 hypothetical protein A3K86_03145 [Photobacterium jeanii]PST92403.1 DUF3466 domain-containing protein [Photobacterium jeanii]
MQQKLLKLSTLAILIAGVTSAHAAVYKIVEVEADGSVDAIDYYGKTTNQRTEYYGQAIKPSASENCFDGSCGNGDAYTLVGESRFGASGLEYRDEVAYISDILQEINDVSTLESYCKNNLGFNTCLTWAESRYYGTGYNTEDVRDESGFGGLLREQQAFRNGYTRNSFLLKDGAPVKTFAETSGNYDNVSNLGTLKENSMNSVPNGIVTDGSTDVVYGVTSAAYFAKDGRFARPFTKRGFVQDIDGTNSAQLLPPESATKLATAMGTSTAWGAVKNPSNSNLLVVGSASFTESYLDDSRKLPSSNNLHIGGTDVGLSTDKLKNCPSQASSDLNGLFNTWECQFTMFSNDAYLWTVNPADGKSKAIRIAERKNTSNDGNTLPAQDPDEKRRSYQASARSIAVVDSKPIIVGYSTERVSNDYYAQRATIYTPKSTLNLADVKDDQWTPKFIGPTIKDGDKRQFTYTMATDINTNNKVIGVAKLDRAESRAYAERMFIYDNNNSSFKYLDNSINGIFFDGSNGYAAAINNKDMVVGKLDAETANQVDGRQRRQRGFLYNAGSQIANSPLNAGGAWFLDDLTNDGVTKGNKVANSYRIAEAGDINDAGVISATAIYCEGGYDNLSQGATCQNGAKNVERVVAVKLVPIKDGQISARPAEETQIKRNGSSLGMLALTLLGWIGFRRRK